MKHLHLKSSNFKHLEQGFKEWLDILGYAETTVNTLPVHVRELLNYLETIKQITHITQVKPRHISEFIKYLKTRRNNMYGGSLSASHINKSIQSINTFARYLNQTGKSVIDIITKRMTNDVDERTILTGKEIKTLYEASFEPHPTFNSKAMGQRDRAIIAIFYGCGLRKDEGTKLDITDIDLIKGLVFVRKGKGNKQRYVPIAQKHLEDLRSYIEEGRYWYLQDNRTAWHVKKGMKKENADSLALLLNVEGKRMKSFDARFKYLKEKTEIEKQFSTHSLRHSIATHLLQSGMPIEEIAKFLGHSSLESTQIYTHIVNTLKKQEDEPTEFLLLPER
ncbi:MAG: tyrosine-type recombinase/integrase [Bacteroidetes bacterium]|nr:tyrosine-type recombinase/integrase [Bacteroidota bacterium]HET6243912.1 tyrosine-type recombinase/integrase [Bacteroidia bacterium]